MKKYLNQLLLTLALFSVTHSATAQRDTLLDLGRVAIRKDFAQTVTVKGVDLEQMPFASLSEAVNAWLQGRLTNRYNTVFVVDGNLVNDVNAWSIYDIEEITLVQNALVQVSGSVNQQQMVLVKTKRNKYRGFMAAGSSYLVNYNSNSSLPDTKSENNFYHQYHVSAWLHNEKLKFGLSANVLRDVAPAVKDQNLTVNKLYGDRKSVV